MKHLSECITTWLINTGTISQEDRELYEYATYSFIISILPLMIIVIIGFMMGKVAESILIIIPFMCIRKFSGGIHAKHSWVCMISSCGILFLCVYGISYIRYDFITNIIVVCSVLSLILFSPIDSENRKLNLMEKRKFKKVTIIIVIIFFAIYCLLSLLQNKIFALSIAEGIILTASLQVPCVVKEIRNNVNSYIFKRNNSTKKI